MSHSVSLSASLNGSYKKIQTLSFHFIDLKKHLKRLHKLMDRYISKNWIYQMTGMGAHYFYKKVRYYLKSRSGMMEKCINEVKLYQILLKYTVWKIKILTVLLLTFISLCRCSLQTKHRVDLIKIKSVLVQPPQSPHIHRAAYCSEFLQ